MNNEALILFHNAQNYLNQRNIIQAEKIMLDLLVKSMMITWAENMKKVS